MHTQENEQVSFLSEPLFVAAQKYWTSDWLKKYSILWQVHGSNINRLASVPGVGDLRGASELSYFIARRNKRKTYELEYDWNQQRYYR